ncbi:lipocalin-like domain-containing protein [Aquimarina sediminis]|uniref:lipocalin family protein n=1 Tax=Aquimarina sediminis TaxID=2070536 RepID=UPI000CA0139C|nr:lipocalin family protein [Aquimarina sediminis]
MKKPILFILLIAAIFTSCSSDDDSSISENTKSNLIGKWQWTASTINGEDISLDKCDIMNTLDFKANDVITSTTFSTITVVNNGQTTTTCEQESLESGEWSLSENNIITKFGNESSSVKILELTSTSVKFEETEEYKDQAGNTVKDTYTDTYKKI